MTRLVLSMASLTVSSLMLLATTAGAQEKSCETDKVNRETIKCLEAKIAALSSNVRIQIKDHPEFCLVYQGGTGDPNKFGSLFIQNCKHNEQLFNIVK